MVPRKELQGLKQPVALVCSGAVCAEPVHTPDALRQMLETFGRSG